MIRYFGLTVCFFIVLGSVIYLNPLLVSSEPVGTSFKKLSRQVDLSTFTFQIAESTAEESEVQFLYRGNFGRHGIAKISKPIKSFETSYEGSKINIGVHTASKSSVAVDDSGYYVGSDEGRLYAYGLDNKLKWSLQFASSRQGIHGTATTDEKYLYIGTYRGHVYCIRKEDGSIMWQTAIADAIGTSPLLVADALYVSAEYQGRSALMVKLSKSTGQKIWNTDLFREQTHSSPALSESGRILVLGDNAGILRGIDSLSGDEIWRVPMGGAIKGTPLIFENTVYAGSWGKEFCAFDVRSGSQLWCKSMSGNVQASAALEPASGDLIVLSATPSTLYRLAARDGRVLWKKKKPLGREGLSSPVILKSSQGSAQLLAPCKKKTLCLIDLENGDDLAEVDLPQSLSGVPSIFKDEIFLALDMGGVLRLKMK